MKKADTLVPGMVAISLLIFAAFHFQSPSPVYSGIADVRLPDPKLTPGATNPTITDSNVDQTICSKDFRTGSVRDAQSSAAQKNTTYALYKIPHPANNTGANQTCELDHLISLELGGSDALVNIWPECGPAGVPLKQRYFKQKDLVENYLHKLVCSHDMTLLHAQNQISTDWYTVYQYLQSGQGGTPSFGGTSLDDNDPDDNP